MLQPFMLISQKLYLIVTSRYTEREPRIEAILEVAIRLCLAKAQLELQTISRLAYIAPSNNIETGYN